MEHSAAPALLPDIGLHRAEGTTVPSMHTTTCGQASVCLPAEFCGSSNIALSINVPSVRRQEWATVLQRLVELPFVPLEMHRVQLCATAVRSMHPAFADRLPRLLSAAAQALASQKQVQALRAVVAFAGDVTFRVPHEVFLELNRLYNSVS